MTLVSLKKKEGLLYPENILCSLLHWSLQGENSRFPSFTSAKTPGILSSLSNSGSQIPPQSGHRVHGQFFHGKPFSCTLWGEKLEVEAVLGPDTCHLYWIIKSVPLRQDVLSVVETPLPYVCGLPLSLPHQV